jgi:hypothetical protein
LVAGAEFLDLAPIHGDLARHVALKRYILAVSSNEMPDQLLAVFKSEHIRLWLAVEADKGQQANNDEGNSLSS